MLVASLRHQHARSHLEFQILDYVAKAVHHRTFLWWRSYWMLLVFIGTRTQWQFVSTFCRTHCDCTMH